MGATRATGATTAAAEQGEASYGYPIHDPLLATVVGTPPDLAVAAPAGVPMQTRRVELFPEREVPSVFWADGRLSYGFSRQKRPAPLVFVLAGTGSSFRADKVRFLQAVLWARGFHVATVTSPTHTEFLLAGSTTGMPGLSTSDASDLYAALKAIVADLRADDVEITEFSLTGYSLGATEAAFLAALDEREHAFDFQRVLLINPAVDLYKSALVFDAMFARSLDDGAAGVERLVAGLLGDITEYVHGGRSGPLDAELLYHIADRRQPSDLVLQRLIAMVFRLAAANMVFVADVLHGGGHVVPAGMDLGVSTSLTPFFKESVRWSFERYVDEMLVPFWQARRSGTDKRSLIAEASLASIATFLQRADGVAVVTNADDPILDAQDLRFLEATFGPRLQLYPDGGHCGNFRYRPNVEWVVSYLEGTRAGDASARADMATRSQP